MKRWFSRLPIHRKLVVMALAVTTAALLCATVGLSAFDIWRYRRSVQSDTRSLAEVIARNSAAALDFGRLDEATDILSTASVSPGVRRACLYRPDGTLAATFARVPELACPDVRPPVTAWGVVADSAPITRSGRVFGAAYVERELTEIGERIAVAGLAGLGMLILAGTVALALAYRLQRFVSEPIVKLASAARAIGSEGEPAFLPDVRAGEDEVGELVRAFSDMLRRTREATARLVESNEALQREVHERRRMQDEREQLLARELEASRLKDEFLAAVSHELRTPLNAILGWLQVLTAAKPSEQTLSKAIASLMRNAHAQNRVIEDLLDVSRIITRKLQLKLDAVDLRSIIESTIETVVPAAAAKGILLNADVPRIACMVHGDYDRLRQIVWNLVSNAVKFTPAGGAVNLRLSVQNGRHEIVVSDNGPGISAAFLPHVFERFRQADGSTTREHGGLGLGLAIVKELTELHGGTVHAASAGDGKGAVFTVTLPQFVGNPAGEADAASPPSDPLPRLDGIRVLAVDDNPDALDVVTAALSDAGAVVRIASSGLEALDQWRRDTSDIVLCDLAMPSMDGFEVLRRIHQMDTGGRVTPVVAVTAYASDEYRARCLNAGFKAHVAKPFNTSELIRVVATAMERV